MRRFSVSIYGFLRSSHVTSALMFKRYRLFFHRLFLKPSQDLTMNITFFMPSVVTVLILENFALYHNAISQMFPSISQILFLFLSFYFSFYFILLFLLLLPFCIVLNLDDVLSYESSSLPIFTRKIKKKHLKKSKIICTK